MYVLVVDKIATLLQMPLCQHIQEIPHLIRLRIAHPVTIHLIGADHHWDAVEHEVIRRGGPTAVASKLGYLLSGPLQTSSVSTSNTVISLLQTLSSTKKKEIDLQHFWSLESIDVSTPVEKNDRQNFLDCYLNSSITRTAAITRDFLARKIRLLSLPIIVPVKGSMLHDPTSC